MYLSNMTKHWWIYWYINFSLTIGFAAVNIWKGCYAKLAIFYDGRILRDSEKIMDFDFVHHKFVVVNESLKDQDAKEELKLSQESVGQLL